MLNIFKRFRKEDNEVVVVTDVTVIDKDGNEIVIDNNEEVIAEEVEENEEVAMDNDEAEENRDETAMDNDEDYNNCNFDEAFEGFEYHETTKMRYCFLFIKAVCNSIIFAVMYILVHLLIVIADIHLAILKYLAHKLVKLLRKIYC